MTSTGSDQRAYQMTMSKGDPSYQLSPRRVLFAERGTEVRISPLLEGIRTLSGEKIQWYLASELRDRIRSSAVRISVIDKLARKQFEVEPRQFDGRFLHQLPLGPHLVWRCLCGTVCGRARGGLARRAVPLRHARGRGLGSLPGLEHAPWTSSYLAGTLDVPFLNLTPGTRSGIIHDERYAAMSRPCEPLEEHLNGLIAEQQRAEEEQASQQLDARHSARLSRGTAGPAAGRVRLVRGARALKSTG